MNTTLFDIRTTVTALHQGETEAITSVRITARSGLRSAIWDLAANRVLNPGVARYDGGVPTVVTLTPYPGYEGYLVANMAYAFACLAQATETDYWTDLHNKSCIRSGDSWVSFEGFVPMPEVINQLQRLYLRQKMGTSLRHELDSISSAGLNTAQIYNWQTEAVECFRRMTPANQGAAERDVNLIGDYKNQARLIDETRSNRFKVLSDEVKAFTRLAEDENTPMFYLATRYDDLVGLIAAERGRLNLEVENFRATWSKIQDLMVTIRKASPPPPVAAKK